MSLTLGIIFGLVTMFGWGISKIFTKKLVDRYGSYTPLIYVHAVLSFLLILCAFISRNFTIPSFNTFLLILLLAFLGAVAILLLYKAIRIGKLSIVISVSHTYAALVVIFAIIFFREILATRQIIAILLIIPGAILISLKYSEIKRLKPRTIAKGVPYALITSVCWGLIYFLLKYPVSAIGAFPTSVYFEFFVFAFVLIPVFFRRRLLKKIRRPHWWLVLGVAVLAAIGSVAYNLGISMELVAIVGPLSACSMLVVVVLSRIFLKEKIEPTQAIAILMIFGGILLLAL